MLETVKNIISQKVVTSFEEKFTDYLISVHDTNIGLELKYLQKHNKLDVMKLDKLISLSFEKAIML